MMKLPLILATAAAISAGSAADESICYDVKLVAKPIAQVPNVFPEADCADCIVMRWPWFLDLRVKRVVEGSLEGEQVRVLTVQHATMKPRNMTWWLRRNSAGGFNAIWADDEALARRCPPDTPLAVPYIQPGPGETLDDLRVKGLQAYDRDRD
jgi:hypothetical protein